MICYSWHCHIGHSDPKVPIFFKAVHFFTDSSNMQVMINNNRKAHIFT